MNKTAASQKICAIIQARMGSKRLSGKVMKMINNKPMLEHVIKQVKFSKLVKKIVVATTNLREDDVIFRYCKNNKIFCFRGSTHDLLDRYYKCANKYHCDPIVRITSDCPLIDPTVIDKVIEKFLDGSFDYVGNNLEKIKGKWENATCNFPQGMTVEISTFAALEKAWKDAKKPTEREHVFPYIQFNSDLFRISNLKHKKDLSNIRCTVDRIQDLNFVKQIYQKAPHKKFIKINDIVKIIKKQPKLVEINNKIPFDEGYAKSLLDDQKKGFG